MTNNNHPITPPDELVQQWINKHYGYGCKVHREPGGIERTIATQAARWGADMELVACCEYIAGPGKWFANPEYRIAELRTARRPKPPSLKEQALKAVQNIDDACESEGFSRRDDTDIIRRALEALPD